MKRTISFANAYLLVGCDTIEIWRKTPYGEDIKAKEVSYSDDAFEEAMDEAAVLPRLMYA